MGFCLVRGNGACLLEAAADFVAGSRASSRFGRDWGPRLSPEIREPKTIKLDGFTKVHGQPDFYGYTGFFIRTTKDFLFACR